MGRPALMRSAADACDGVGPGCNGVAVITVPTLNTCTIVDSFKALSFNGFALHKNLC